MNPQLLENLLKLEMTCGDLLAFSGIGVSILLVVISSHSQAQGRNNSRRTNRSSRSRNIQWFNKFLYGLILVPPFFLVATLLLLNYLSFPYFRKDWMLKIILFSIITGTFLLTFLYFWHSIKVIIDFFINWFTKEVIRRQNLVNSEEP